MYADMCVCVYEPCSVITNFKLKMLLLKPTQVEVNVLVDFPVLDLCACVCEMQVKVDEAHQALMEVTKRNTEILRKKKNLLDETMELERKLNGRQNKIVIFLLIFISQPKLGINMS